MCSKLRNMLVLAWIGLGIGIGATGCATGRYYGGMALEQTAIARGERATLLADLGPRLQTSGVTRLDVSTGTQRIEVTDADWTEQGRLGEVPTPALAALRFGLDKKARGAELDLLVHVAADSAVPVTVLNEPDGLILIRQGEPQPVRQTALPPTPQEMKSRYGIGPSDFGEVPWTPEYLRVVDRALSLLSPEERAFLSQVPIVREHRPASVFVPPRFSEHVMAMYTQRMGVARVELYDILLDDDERLFCGTPEAPLTRSVMYVLHELGHVIAIASKASALRDITRKVDGYVDRVQELAEKGSDGKGTIWVTEEENEELDKKEWDIEDAFNHLERLGQRGPVIRAYRWARGSSKGPTPYSAVSIHESFAESFAMFHADPAALRRIDPATHDWFERGEHMRAMAE